MPNYSRLDSCDQYSASEIQENRPLLPCVRMPPGRFGFRAGPGHFHGAAFQDKLTLSLPACRFPNLFPPLKPETVARRTVEAVQLNQALLLLPWTMHALIILKRYRAAGGSSESGSCGPCPLLPGDLGGEEASNKRKNPHDRLVMSAVGVKMRVMAYRSWSYYP